MQKLRVKLLGSEHSAGRGVGFYRSHLADALLASGEVELVESGEQIVHYPFFDLFYPTLKTEALPTIVTIHDVTPLVFPKLYPLGFRARFALEVQKQALKNVDAILTDSLSSKKDIANYLNLPSEKIHVTYLAADPIYQTKPREKLLRHVREKYGLPDKFILYVGGVNPNKNLVRLARAAERLKTPLVLVGSEFIKVPVETFSVKRLLGLQAIHPEIKEFTRLKEIIQGDSHFLTPGFVPNEELNAIYHLADVYCQPSLYEGFGLPVLEAMTAGCLVASSTGGSLPEIYPPNTISFEPESEAELERAIASALTITSKERKGKIKTAAEKARDFSWEKTAAATIEVYRSVLQ